MTAKSTKNVAPKPQAWIVNSSDQGRKSIKNENSVYLEDNTEFKIELFNPLNVNVLADIKINSQHISKNGLVIKPGQRFYLDCYLDDRKKFVFKTYDVENTNEAKEAIKDNGVVEIFFYKEEILMSQTWNTYTKPYFNDLWCNTKGKWVTFDSNITNGSNTKYFDYSSTLSSNTNIRSKNISCTLDDLGSLETGRIEKGENSNQNFEKVDIKFENLILSSFKYYLLPESQKPIETESLKSNNLDYIDILKKLWELHQSGILTDDEFTDKKKNILNKI